MVSTAHAGTITTPGAQVRVRRMTELEDQTFMGELHTLLVHGFFEVVSLLRKWGIGFCNMTMRFFASHRSQRISFLRCQIRQMMNEGDDFPDFFVGVRGAEGGHGRHPDAMFDDPE